MTGKPHLSDRLNRFIPTRTILFITFVVLFALGLLSVFVMSILTDGASFTTLFSPFAETNWFMDFLSSVRDCSVSEVYGARKVFYPPFCVLLLRCISYLFSHVTLSGYAEASTVLMHRDFVSYVVYFFFALVCILGLTKMINVYLRNYNQKVAGQVISFLIVFSYPSLYGLERGNTTMLAVALTMFFVFFYDNKSSVIAELALVSLAFASGVKIYPAVFGVLVLFDKKYKEAVRLIIYGIIVFVFPALIISKVDGIGIVQMVTSVFGNFGKFSENRELTFNLSSVGTNNLVVFLGKNSSLGNDQARVASLCKVVFIITELIALVASFFAPKTWQKVFFVSYIILNISSISSSYLFLFIVIPFVIFMSGKAKFALMDWFYFIFYCLFLVPLPSIGMFNEPWWKSLFYDKFHVWYVPRVNQWVAVWFFQLMFVMLTVETIIYFAKVIKLNKDKRFFRVILEWNDKTNDVPVDYEADAPVDSQTAIDEKFDKVLSATALPVEDDSKNHR